MAYCKLEIKKLLQEKLLISFIAICLCLNIGLSFVHSYARETVNQLSIEDFSQNGEKVYDDLDGAVLGTVYYNERYINSSILNQWIKEKYENLQSAIDLLNDEEADLSFYAGEMTPTVHEALFAYQLKALLIECVLFFSLLCLRTFSIERQSETAALIYSSKRGRNIAKDKILANGIIGFLYCATLITISLIVFFCNWDFSNIWNMNIASSFNYVHETNDAVYLKPFITWTSLTVKEYFICSLLLIGAILVAWWLISNIVALFVSKDLFGGLLIAAILCLPYFGLMIFPGLHLTMPFYLSTLSISMVIYYSHMWFTDLGHYTLFAYQEIWIVLIHILAAICVIGFGVRYFRRKELI